MGFKKWVCSKSGQEHKDGAWESEEAWESDFQRRNCVMREKMQVGEVCEQ